MGESSDWSQDNHCKLKTVGCSSFDSDLESVFSPFLRQLPGE